MQLNAENAPLLQGPITALVTPFKNGDVDYAGFAHLVEWQISEGVQGFLVNSLAGEGPTLEEEERRSLLALCLQIAKGRVPVIAATGTNCTAKTLERTLEAQAQGADYALITVPYYSRPIQKGILQHYAMIAEATKIPIIVHNASTHTAVKLRSDTIHALSDNANVIGIIDEDRDAVELRKLMQDICVGTFCIGSEAVELSAPPALDHGSFVSVVANLYPGHVCAWYEARKSGALDYATKFSDRLRPLVEAIGSESAPAALKYALTARRGLDNSLRLPLLPISEETAQVIKRLMRNLRDEDITKKASDLIAEAARTRRAAPPDIPPFSL
ncbi:dihydrodipicolinate synthase family protein [Oryzifoliimicrobium ureilyticus]|uniref:dihydrodipicolinate synthase family protein n=1 Tax=Oryzifoliimicrobium ureilyticus TaxID=3113724 RepID=UPI0030760CF9